MMMSNSFQFVFLFLLIVVSFTLQSKGNVESNVPQCKGAFDFYFVLDSSGSVGDNFKTEIVPFVNNVSTNFVNPNFRLSFVTFASRGFILLNLTSDRKEIAQGLDNLQSHTVGGSTNLATGLSMVNKQIDTFGGDTASVILILTDGVISDQSQTITQASIIRSKGASIFAIGIANANENQLKQLVNDEKEVFIGGDFQYLTTIINQVINDTCIEILTADPIEVCANQISESLTTTLTGQGFTNTIDPNTTACRFVYNETEFQISKPVGQVEYDKIVCSIPNFRIPQEVLLQVTLNGLTYISSNVTLSVIDCTPVTPKPVNAGLAAGLTLSFLTLIVLIIVILLWFFIPLITGKIIFQPKPAPTEETNDYAEPKKWGTVDASYYGGRGAGGIAPMRVHWGDKGATLEGNKLTAAKDATVLEMGEEGSPTNTSQKGRHGPSCLTKTWNTIKRWFMSGYYTLSSIRPVRNSEGNIMWCPYRELNKHHQDNSNSSVSQTASGGLSNPLYDHIDTVKGNTQKQNQSLPNNNKSVPPPPPPKSGSISGTREAPPSQPVAPPNRPPLPTRSNTLPARPPPPRPPTK